MDPVNNSFLWNLSVNHAVERTMKTIRPPLFSCNIIKEWFVFKSRLWQKLRFVNKYFSQFVNPVKNSFWWNRSVNRAVERTMQTIAPPSFSCHKIVSSMSNNEGGETAIMSRKKRDVIYIFSHPPFKRSFLCVWEKNQYSLFYCFSKLETKETIMSRKKGYYSRVHKST